MNLRKWLDIVIIDCRFGLIMIFMVFIKNFHLVVPEALECTLTELNRILNCTNGVLVEQGLLSQSCILVVKCKGMIACFKFVSM